MKKTFITLINILVLTLSLIVFTNSNVSAAELDNDNGREHVVIGLTFDTRPPVRYYFDRGDKRGWLNRSQYEQTSSGIWIATYTGYISYNAPINPYKNVIVALPIFENEVFLHNWYESISSL